jgi:hypothetical protein
MLKPLQIVFICACFCDMETKWLMSMKEGNIRTASVQMSRLTLTNMTLLSKPNHIKHFLTFFKALNQTQSLVITLRIV